MRKNKLNTLVKIFLFLIMILILMQSNTLAYTEEIKLASGIIDPNDFAPEPIENAFEQANVVVDMGSTMISVIRVIGIIVTVIALMIIGIKYMTGSVEEKADYKKSMIPYLIGVFIFLALSQLIAIIMNLVAGLNI